MHRIDNFASELPAPPDADNRSVDSFYDDVVFSPPADLHCAIEDQQIVVLSTNR